MKFRDRPIKRIVVYSRVARDRRVRQFEELVDATVEPILHT